MTLIETGLRNLVSAVSMAIETRFEVLSGVRLKAPNLEGAAFTPIDQSEATAPKPIAHRFVADIDTADLPQSSRDIVAQIRELEEHLIWGHAPGYTEEKVGREFLDNYCHALLTGPDGPLRCASPLGAFVLFGPGTLYQDHHHAPNEIYLAVTGGGQWKVGQHGWTPLNAGEVIFIPSNAVHAIQAGEEPLLTFSFWLEAGDMHDITV